MENQNRLRPENCNKAKCKTCIFGPTPVQLSEARQKEILDYLSSFECTHICHTTNLTCYGALEFQARLLKVMGLLPDEKVETLLDHAKQYLERELPNWDLKEGE